MEIDAKQILTKLCALDMIETPPSTFYLRPSNPVYAGQAFFPYFCPI